jgi:hypothetical protein
MKRQLQRELAIFHQLRARLVIEFPDLDNQTLLDSLEGLTSLNETLESVVRSREEDISIAEALKCRLDGMNQRLARLRMRADKKKEIVAEAMDRSGVRKIEAPEFTISCRRTSPALLVDDESAVPEKYWKPQPDKLDRSGLITALKAGESISGAILGNGGVTISVRRG